MRRRDDRDETMPTPTDGASVETRTTTSPGTGYASCRAHILYYIQCSDFPISLTHVLGISYKKRSNSLPS